MVGERRDWPAVRGPAGVADGRPRPCRPRARRATGCAVAPAEIKSATRSWESLRPWRRSCSRGMAALLIRAGWAEPGLAAARVGGFGQQADALREITCPKRRQLLHIRDGQRHRLAEQWFAVGRRTARAGTPAA